MKTILSTLAFLVCFTINSVAQCSDVKNNFELQLVQVSKNKMTINIKHTSTNNGAQSVAPTKKTMLDGLVFAIANPKGNASVKIENVTTTLMPFDLVIDNNENAVTAKKAMDVMTTIYHNAQMPSAFITDWQNDTWYQLAIITYTGTLQTDDFFSLVDCNYGIANPNSYSGNSTTDPWFAVMDETNNYLQYSPKMSTALPIKISEMNSVNVYPVPTNGNVTMDVQATEASNAVIKIVDIKGALVKTILVEMNSGMNQYELDSKDLPSGEYFVVISNGKAFSFTNKIVKQ
jgi:hypothetical protein